MIIEGRGEGEREWVYILFCHISTGLSSHLFLVLFHNHKSWLLAQITDCPMLESSTLDERTKLLSVFRVSRRRRRTGSPLPIWRPSQTAARVLPSTSAVTRFLRSSSEGCGASRGTSRRRWSTALFHFSVVDFNIYELLMSAVALFLFCFTQLLLFYVL